ncbi:DoxX family protein [Ktedonobacter racemifer]|uniref:DoxX family protein n=1 Tax=Ktedonobacter racemifer DSM 44963 TaxID=485913 RepID=D6U766_KTERA|nr:DoxX family protein [Ktedonobacter racemifer]EFH79727.1 DoxX family protein [Ktedonobacter racemifer DSM 44963]
MKNATQLTAEISVKQQKRSVNVTLWIVQVLLTLLFLLVGGMKLIVPVEVLLAQMPIQMPGPLIRLIGVIEVAGALGLILPGLLRIRPVLTPLAACGLVIEMIGATVYTVAGGQGAEALLPLVLALICAFVAYGRRPWASR